MNSHKRSGIVWVPTEERKKERKRKKERNNEIKIILRTLKCIKYNKMDELVLLELLDRDFFFSFWEGYYHTLFDTGWKYLFSF